MSISINGVATAAAFPPANAGGCQLGPSGIGRQLDLVVGNAAAVIQLMTYADPTLGIGGGITLSDEFVLIAGNGQISQASYIGCVGFKARDFVPGTHATVYGIVWEKGDPVPIGGTNYSGTLSGSGSGPGGATVGFQHNGVVVGTEGNLDFEDGNNNLWTVTDDPANLRVKVFAAPQQGNAVAQYPNDPAQTTALSPGVMMGTGCSFTPTRVGGTRAAGAFAFNLTGAGFGNQVNCTIRFGTGAAPTNGSAPAGSGVIPINAYATDPVTAWVLPWTIAGLTAGTTYWFDLLVFFSPYGAVNPTAPNHISFSAWEL